MTKTRTSGKGAEEREVIQEETSWEHRGFVFSPGDPIRFSGKKGKFQFRSYGHSDKTGTDWVTVWEEGRCFRSFSTALVLLPKTQGKGRSSSEAAPLCVDHKTYQAKRTPRTDCARCWAAYENNKKEK